MRLWKKATAVIFAAAIICSISVTGFAAEDNFGDEWETEEISSVEEESTLQDSKKQQSDTAKNIIVSHEAVSEAGKRTVSTGDDTSNGVLAVGIMTAVSLAAAAVSRRRKNV